jgi:hypothetical protein
MIPYLTDVFNSFLEKVLPACSKDKARTFFFDLADPEKRSEADLLEVLGVFSKFDQFGKVILGLNLREAEQVDALLGLSPEAALTVAVATSGYYVRTAVSPTLDHLSEFIQTDGALFE